jgi:hypothetical protein
MANDTSRDTPIANTHPGKILRVVASGSLNDSVIWQSWNCNHGSKSSRPLRCC